MDVDWVLPVPTVRHGLQARTHRGAGGRQRRGVGGRSAEQGHAAVAISQAWLAKKCHAYRHYHWRYSCGTTFKYRPGFVVDACSCAFIISGALALSKVSR